MPLNDRNANKVLKYARLYIEGAGTVTLKYLMDGKNSTGGTTYENIFSETVTDTDRQVNATQLADNQSFGSGSEIQFQIETTGGVAVRSIEYDYDKLND